MAKTNQIENTTSASQQAETGSQTTASNSASNTNQNTNQSSTSSTQSLIPEWYTNYAQNILNQQAAASQQPYQAYTGQQVADLNATQQQGMNSTLNAANSYQPLLNGALSTAANTADRSGLGAAQGYLQAASDNSAAQA